MTEHAKAISGAVAIFLLVSVTVVIRAHWDDWKASYWKTRGKRLEKVVVWENRISGKKRYQPLTDARERLYRVEGIYKRFEMWATPRQEYILGQGGREYQEKMYRSLRRASKKAINREGVWEEHENQIVP